MVSTAASNQKCSGFDSWLGQGLSVGCLHVCAFLASSPTFRRDKPVRRAGSVVGLKQDSLESGAVRRTLSKLLTIMDNERHPLHDIMVKCRDQ